MKKYIFIILFLLISTNLAYANVDSKEKNGIPAKDEIIQYLQIYLQTYNGLVETQKEFNNDQFFLSNKTFLINIVISNYEFHDGEIKGQVAFVFDKAEYNKSKYEFLQTNRSIGDLIFHEKWLGDSGETTEVLWWGHPNLLITNYRNAVYYQNGTIDINATMDEKGEYFYYLMIINFEDLKPELAVESANYNFNEEYRDVKVQKAQKIAEENYIYKNYKELKKHNDLMNERKKKGLYFENRTLFKEDVTRFDELANKSGLSGKESETYSALPIPKKNVLGIDGIEYENNLYGYILPFFILMAVSTVLRTKLDKIKMESLEKYYDFFSIPAIAVYFYAIKPFDIQNYESGIILLIFIIFTFFILKYETKKRTIEK